MQPQPLARAPPDARLEPRVDGGHQRQNICVAVAGPRQLVGSLEDEPVAGTAKALDAGRDHSAVVFERQLRQRRAGSAPRYLD